MYRTKINFVSALYKYVVHELLGFTTADMLSSEYIVLLDIMLICARLIGFRLYCLNLNYTTSSVKRIMSDSDYHLLFNRRITI